MRYLLDTNILSELRRGIKAGPGLVTWFDDQPAEALFISAVTVGEIRQGIEQIRRKDPARAGLLDRWVRGLAQYYEDRLLYVDGAIAEEWGRLSARRNVPVIDGLGGSGYTGQSGRILARGLAPHLVRRADRAPRVVPDRHPRRWCHGGARLRYGGWPPSAGHWLLLMRIDPPRALERWSAPGLVCS